MHKRERKNKEITVDWEVAVRDRQRGMAGMWREGEGKKKKSMKK